MHLERVRKVDEEVGRLFHAADGIEARRADVLRAAALREVAVRSHGKHAVCLLCQALIGEVRQGGVRARREGAPVVPAYR